MNEARERLRENVQPLLKACADNKLNPIEWLIEADTSKFVRDYDSAVHHTVGFALGYLAALAKIENSTEAEVLAHALTHDETRDLLDWAALKETGLSVEFMSFGINVHGPKGVLKSDGTWSPGSASYTVQGTNYFAQKKAIELARAAIKADSRPLMQLKEVTLTVTVLMPLGDAIGAELELNDIVKQLDVDWAADYRVTGDRVLEGIAACKVACEEHHKDLEFFFTPGEWRE